MHVSSGATPYGLRHHNTPHILSHSLPDHAHPATATSPPPPHHSDHFFCSSLLVYDRDLYGLHLQQPSETHHRLTTSESERVFTRYILNSHSMTLTGSSLQHRRLPHRLCVCVFSTAFDRPHMRAHPNRQAKTSASPSDAPPSPSATVSKVCSLLSAEDTCRRCTTAHTPDAASVITHRQGTCRG